MSDVKTISEYTCKLCGRANQAPGNELPFGWIKHVTENMYDERSFNESYICDHCLSDIDKQRDFKAGKKVFDAVLRVMPPWFIEKLRKGELP